MSQLALAKAAVYHNMLVALAKSRQLCSKVLGCARCGKIVENEAFVTCEACRKRSREWQAARAAERRGR